MKRHLPTIIAFLGLAVVSFFVVPAAQAITNPADNPVPITVKGDDGQTYEDGKDTLPGYDDEACTYIPGAYFDFDNNRVHYADGQSIPWTEWDRATGYKEWKAKQGSGSTPKPSSSPTKKPTPKPSGGGSTGGGSNTAGTGGGSSNAGGSTGGSGAAGAPDATSTNGATPSASADAKADAKADDAGAIDGTDSVAAGDDVESVELAAGTSDDAGTGSSGGGSAGLLILGGLAGAGLLTFAGYSVLGKRKRADSAA